MKLADIPHHLGIPAAQLADKAGVLKQNLWAYMRGPKGKPSKVIDRVLQAAGFSREEIYFPNPEGYTPESPEYWALIVNEAKKEAEKRK
jgi:hypothetical protein